jgi:hypothetical protein
MVGKGWLVTSLILFCCIPGVYAIGYFDIWELHPGYIHLTKMVFDSDNYRGNIGAPAITDATEWYELQYSSNVNDVVPSIGRPYRYRGNTYRSLYLYMTSRPNSRSPYFVSIKLKNAPYLHRAKDPEDKLRLISIGKDPPGPGVHDIVVIAIPEGTPIQGVPDYQPYRIEKREGWYLFYYDTSRIKSHVSLHVYYLEGEDAESLDPLTIFEWSKKQPVNPISIQDIITPMEPQSTDPIFKPWMMVLVGSWLVGIMGYFVVNKTKNSKNISFETVEKEYQKLVEMKEANLISEEKFKLKEREIEEKIALLEKELE